MYERIVSTAQTYLSGIKKWRENLEKLENNYLSYYLENISNDNDEGRRVVLYMVHLYLIFGLREEQIIRRTSSTFKEFQVSSLKWQWYRECETSFISIQKVRNSFSLTISLFGLHNARIFFACIF